MRNIVVCGAGGFGAEAMWGLEEMNRRRASSDRWNILGYVDDDVSKKGSVFYGYKNLGSPDEIASMHDGTPLWFYCAVGCNRTRSELAARLEGYGWRAATLIHPSVIVARDIIVGEGTYIGAGCIVCPNAVIGRHVLVNNRAAIGHDSRLGDFSQICPGGQVNGACTIGEGAFVGSNASVYPGKKVGEWASVGANSHVLRSVKPGATVSGVPAVLLG